MDSCGAPAEMWRRSEETLRGGDALDKVHGSAAKRTLPQRVNWQRRRGGARCWRMGLLEQARTEWKEFCSPPVSKKSEVADAHEAAWQQVEKEAAQELFDRQSLLPWAESRQRKATFPSARAINLLLEMATRWVYAPR